METKKQMIYISSFANGILLFIAGISFVFLGIFKTWHYQELFDSKFSYWMAFAMGVAMAVMIEGGRLAFMLSSANDMLNKNKKGFYLGLIGSGAFLLFECVMAMHLGDEWGQGETNVYKGIFLCVALLGALIELRLCLMFVDPDGKEKQVDIKTYPYKAITLGNVKNPTLNETETV